MRLGIIIFGCAVVAACSTTKMMERKGFTTELLLRLEKEKWGQPRGQMTWEWEAKHMNVPIDSRPVSIRDLKCTGEVDLYSCDYLIDYGWNGRVDGTFQRRGQTVGRDKDGNWSLDWIFID